MRVAMRLIYMQRHALEELLYSAWALLRKKYNKKVRPSKAAILNFWVALATLTIWFACGRHEIQYTE